MRLRVLWICGLLAACTSSVTVPDDPILSEVPLGGTASSAGGDGFTSTIESSLATDGTVPANVAVAGSVDGTGRALDDDQINLMQWTLEQQKIDAAIAERDLASARSQLVVVQPGPLPSRPEGVNIALFANQTTNAVGQSIFCCSSVHCIRLIWSSSRARPVPSVEPARATFDGMLPSAASEDSIVLVKPSPPAEEAVPPSGTSERMGSSGTVTGPEVQDASRPQIRRARTRM